MGVHPCVYTGGENCSLYFFPFTARKTILYSYNVIEFNIERLFYILTIWLHSIEENISVFTKRVYSETIFKLLKVTLLYNLK